MQSSENEFHSVFLKDWEVYGIMALRKKFSGFYLFVLSDR